MVSASRMAFPQRMTNGSNSVGIEQIRDQFGNCGGLKAKFASILPKSKWISPAEIIIA
jgi:hypothetical protein